MKKLLVIAGLLLLVGAFAFAGGEGESDGGDSMGETGLAWITTDSDDDMLPGVNPLEVTGDIVVAGSSTVFPMAEEVIARWYDEGYSSEYSTTYTSIGSGAGFERFGNGESDVAGASRPIKDSEVESCRGIGASGSDATARSRANAGLRWRRWGPWTVAVGSRMHWRAHSSAVVTRRQKACRVTRRVFLGKLIA